VKFLARKSDDNLAMKTSLPPKNIEAIRAQYKRTHLGRKLRGPLYNAFCKRGATAATVLQALLKRIKARKFRPFFDRKSIDKLFENDVLKVYANGRYFYEKKLDSMACWNDLLNNIGTISRSNRDYLREPDEPISEKREAGKDIKHSQWQLKIIEDWIFYHPKEQQKIQRFIAESQSTTAI
jgi:hypothetical protein